MYKNETNHLSSIACSLILLFARDLEHNVSARSCFAHWWNAVVAGAKRMTRHCGDDVAVVPAANCCPNVHVALASSLPSFACPAKKSPDYPGTQLAPAESQKLPLVFFFSFLLSSQNR